jgi:predicted nucleotidyltransferase/HEPN domain-containing protein
MRTAIFRAMVQAMRTDVDHLPPRKQREIQHIVEVVFEVFEATLKSAAAAWKKRGRIHKVILYGSHARGNWVWEPHTKKGYRSDYDLLIIVNSKRIVDDTRFGYELDQRFIKEMLEKQISAPVSAVVHTKQEVNNALAQGRYFFMDVAEEGIAVYQEDDKPLRKPIPQTPESALIMAKEYFDDWYPNAAEFFDSFEFSKGRGRHRNAAFQLHQAVEQLYHTVLLTKTFYTPHVHNIGFLRTLSEKLDRRMVHVWPADTRKQAGMFNKLKEAYVKARYSNHFRVSAAELEWLGEQAQELARVVRIVCDDRILSLQQDVAKDRPPSADQTCDANMLCRG